MRIENNKLEPYLQNRSIRKGLNRLEDRSPMLFNIIAGVIVGVGKPVMAVRAKLYRATGGVFANSNIPVFRIVLIATAAYVLTQKNLMLNFNLNAPRSTMTQPTSTNVLGVAESIATGNSLPAFTFEEGRDKAYINRFKDVAISEMNKFGILPSIKLAQGLLESQGGKSTFATQLNNHFNQKCGNVEVGVCTSTEVGLLKIYPSAWASWRAHSLLIATNYKSLLPLGTNYKAWAIGLEDLGYTPDKQYAEKLISIIEKYELYRFDEGF